MDKICLNCGKNFTPRNSDPRIKFCSNDCQLEYRRKTSYMQTYYRANETKWKNVQAQNEYKMAKNKARRDKYSQDDEFRNNHKKSVKDYYLSHPEIRFNQRMKQLGITSNDYFDMLKSQNYKCAICDSEIGDKAGNRLYVDHNHKTGKVRGLLCMNCNFAIGQFQDDVNLLKRAIEYLEKE